MILYCTKCRVGYPADELRADRDGYWWCDRCKPGLLGPPRQKRAQSPPAAP